MSYLVFCCKLFYYASFSGLITSVGEERELNFLLSITHYVVSVRRGFLFLLVLRMACVISSPEPQAHQVSL